MTVARLVVIAVCLLLSACSIGHETASAEGEEAFSFGEELAVPHAGGVNVADLRITFSAVTADSRCPKSVVCVWAGDAAIVLEVKRGAETRSVELHTSPPQPRTAEAFDHRIELVRLEPYPDEPGEPKRSAYVAHLVVDGDGKDER